MSFSIIYAIFLLLVLGVIWFFFCIFSTDYPGNICRPQQAWIGLIAAGLSILCLFMNHYDTVQQNEKAVSKYKEAVQEQSYRVYYNGKEKPDIEINSDNIGEYNISYDDANKIVNITPTDHTGIFR